VRIFYVLSKYLDKYEDSRTKIPYIAAFASVSCRQAACKYCAKDYVVWHGCRFRKRENAALLRNELRIALTGEPHYSSKRTDTRLERISESHLKSQDRHSPKNRAAKSKKRYGGSGSMLTR